MGMSCRFRNRSCRRPGRVMQDIQLRSFTSILDSPKFLIAGRLSSTRPANQVSRRCKSTQCSGSIRQAACRLRPCQLHRQGTRRHRCRRGRGRPPARGDRSGWPRPVFPGPGHGWRLGPGPSEASVGPAGVQCSLIPGATCAVGGVSITSASVMPVSEVTSRGTGMPGLTNVSSRAASFSVSKGAQAKRTASASMILSSRGLSPVVSRSSTANRVRWVRAGSNGSLSSTSANKSSWSRFMCCRIGIERLSGGGEETRPGWQRGGCPAPWTADGRGQTGWISATKRLAQRQPGTPVCQTVA